MCAIAPDADELSENVVAALGGDDSGLGLSTPVNAPGVKGSIAVLTLLANLDRLSATESVQVLLCKMSTDSIFVSAGCQ
jgi:hypothetical protein